MKVKPLQDRILIKRVEEEAKTKGGIIIPDSAKEKPQEGLVVAVGPGKVTDNAFMESFFHSMKADVIHGNSFTEDSQMLAVLRSYIPFYNHSRMHSSLNYVSPAKYEMQFA